MDMYTNLVKKSIKIAYNHKGTCLLGFMQFFCIYLTIKLLSNFTLVKFSFVGLLIFGISLTSVFLWKYIVAINSNESFVVSAKTFINLTLKFILVLLVLCGFIFLLKYLNIPWNYFVIISCLMSLICCYLLLGVVVLNLGIFKSFLCTLDFIRTKSSIFYVLFFMLILINAYCYYFAHLLINTRVFGGGFSVFTPSATIWLVFLGVALLATFFSGVINIFLVLLYLDIAKTIKNPSKSQTPLVPIQVN